MRERIIPHFEQLGGNLIVVAKAPIERVTAIAQDGAIRLYWASQLIHKPSNLGRT